MSNAEAFSSAAAFHSLADLFFSNLSSQSGTSCPASLAIFTSACQNEEAAAAAAAAFDLISRTRHS